MNPMDLVRLVRRTGRIAEPAPPAPGAEQSEQPDRGHGTDGFTPPTELAGSVQVRAVDCGSCNGCEIEVGAAFGPVYDAERYGARLVASPRHADVLLVTGAVTHNMAEPLRRTVEATPRPRVVVAVGDCAVSRGAFVDAYGVVGAVDEVVDVDLRVPGCPPEPDQIVAALRRVTQR